MGKDDYKWWEFRFAKAKFDWISPGDIVCVCSTILVGGSLAADGKKYDSRYGPEKTSQKEALGVIRNILGKKLKFKEHDENESVD
jgi:hypothetical protein